MYQCFKIKQNIILQRQKLPLHGSFSETSKTSNITAIYGRQDSDPQPLSLIAFLGSFT